MNKEGGLKVGVVGVPICAYIMLVHLPTTSPYGYSSFPKEENRVTIAYNYSLELLFHIEAGTGFHVFIG